MENTKYRLLLLSRHGDGVVELANRLVTSGEEPGTVPVVLSQQEVYKILVEGHGGSIASEGLGLVREG